MGVHPDYRRFGLAATLKRAQARAAGVLGDRLTLLRDADGDGAYELQTIFAEDLNAPYGLALVDLVVLGDAGEALGDSLYEARLYVRGSVGSLGADCVEKELREEHVAELGALLERAGADADPAGFRRYGSARRLYAFDVDNAGAY